MVGVELTQSLVREEQCVGSSRAQDAKYPIDAR